VAAVRLEVLYECQACGAISAASNKVTETRSERFDMSPICRCDQSQVVTLMELHTRDEA